jgi:hypothetical protein
MTFLLSGDEDKSFVELMERLERALSTDLKRNASQLNGDILVAIV